MKNALLGILAAFAAAGFAAAGESLLADQPPPAPAFQSTGTGHEYCPPPPPVESANLPEADDLAGICPPPPPVESAYCPEPPMAAVCPPAPPICEADLAAAQYRIVPIRKKVREVEVYTDEETRTKVVDEVRTRLVKPASPRLARVVPAARREVALIPHQEKAYVETYVQKVAETYQEPVVKTRTVTREVEEYQVVPERRLFGR